MSCVRSSHEAQRDRVSVQGVRLLASKNGQGNTFRQPAGRVRRPLKSDVGRFVTVSWDDVGPRVAILVGLDGSDARVFEPCGDGVEGIDVKQITAYHWFVRWSDGKEGGE